MHTAYLDYQEPLCNDVRNGFVELLALRVLSLPLEIGLCILGIRFVLRNKVDVPKWVKPKPKKEKKKDKAKKKKDGVDDDAESEDEDDERLDDADEADTANKKSKLNKQQLRPFVIL